VLARDGIPSETVESAPGRGNLVARLRGDGSEGGLVLHHHIDVAPDVLVGFTDNWVFRNCGLHGYGWSPFLVDEDEGRRVHGNDERISLENLREGVRCHTEMLLDVAAA
jgi:acetylornithine deacetylase/succinyl-diaminopimelate desuccinylase-like protein